MKQNKKPIVNKKIIKRYIALYKEDYKLDLDGAEIGCTVHTLYRSKKELLKILHETEMIAKVTIEIPFEMEVKQ